MRYITFVPPDGQPRAGVLLGAMVVDLAAAAPLVLEDTAHMRWDMLSLLSGGEQDDESSSLEVAAEVVAAVLSTVDEAHGHHTDASPDNGSHDQGAAGNISIGGVEMLLALDQVSLLAPLPRPVSLRLFDNTGEFFPAFAFGNHGAIYGLDELVPMPRSDDLRYDLAIGCVIGRTGRDITVDEAAEYIAGYTIVNDWVAYDLASDTLAGGRSERSERSERSASMCSAKARDFATSLGPWLVTPDELEIYAEDDGHMSLTMMARVNSIERARDNFSRARYTFAEMIACASRDTLLYPGDVLSSGDLVISDMSLEEGDVIELEVTGLGVLRNQLGLSRSIY